MSRQFKISTEYTFFLKVILPIIYFGIIALIFYWMISNQEYKATGATAFAAIAGGFVMYKLFINLKSVSIDKEYFYISNYIKTIKIPIADLVEVNDRSYPGSYKPISLYFIGENEFDNPITFLPEFESPNSPSKIPLAEKLRRLM
ncbi:MAG: hypothetical protein AAFQ94_08090 [Bacteroidota bacterium]